MVVVYGWGQGGVIVEWSQPDIGDQCREAYGSQQKYCHCHNGSNTEPGNATESMTTGASVAELGPEPDK